MSRWGGRWGNRWGGRWGSVGSGSIVLEFSGVSYAGSVTYHSGVVRPISIGSNYNETGVSGNTKPDTISSVTYLIDGDIP